MRPSILAASADMEPSVRHELQKLAGSHELEQPILTRGQRHLLHPPKVAALIRTHVVSEKLYHLRDCLTGSTMFDLYVLADETRGRLDVIGAPVIPHSVTMCSTMGLKTNPTNHPNALWLCGDYALYCAERMLPDYDFYVLIEYDVHLVRENPLFLEGIINRLIGEDGAHLDFVCASIQLYPRGNWHKAAARLYKKVYWSGLFSLIFVSKPALLFLLNTRLAEGNNPAARCELIHCETFALTALMNAGTYQCVGLDVLLPGCINRRSFHAGRLDHAKPNYLLGMRADQDPRIELVHPVLDAEQYLAKLWAYWKGNGNPGKFVEHMNSLDTTLVGRNIKARFEALAMQTADNSANMDTLQGGV